MSPKIKKFFLPGLVFVSVSEKTKIDDVHQKSKKLLLKVSWKNSQEVNFEKLVEIKIQFLG